MDAMDNDNDGEVNFKEYAAWKNSGGALVYDEDDTSQFHFEDKLR